MAKRLNNIKVTIKHLLKLGAGNWFSGLGLLSVLVAAKSGCYWVCVVKLSNCSRNVGLGVALHLPITEDY